MKFVSADADFGAESVFKAIGKSSGGINHYWRRTDHIMAKKKTNNDLQNIIHKTKDLTTWTTLTKIQGVNSGAPEG
jgi:hypothetical protein